MNMDINKTFGDSSDQGHQHGLQWQHESWATTKAVTQTTDISMTPNVET